MLKTAGEILKTERLRKKLDLGDVSRVTKIRISALQLIEDNNYQKLPSAAVARGFIRNYCGYLGIDQNHVLSVYRRDFAENRDGSIVPRGVAEPVDRQSLWTPKNTVVSITVFFLIVFFGYLIYQYLLFIGPPNLKINYPPKDITTVESTIEIRGVTDPEATLSINNQIVNLEKGGNFFLRLPLDRGENQIVSIATSKQGKMATITRLVTRQE